MTACASRTRDRTVLFVSTPPLWPCWPFLPVVRRTAGGGEELGVVFDARSVLGRTGYSATVLRCNVFDLPPTVGDLLALPRHAYDSADELAADGWSVD